MGTAPIVGYHYGAGNHPELKSLLKKSLILIAIFGVGMLGASLGLAGPLSHLFVGYNDDMLALTTHAFFIFSFSFLFSGYGIYGSSFFTALNDGFTSAAISFLRTLIFQIAAVLLLPLIWGITGIWVSIVAAEVMALLVTVTLLFLRRKKYRYA